MPIREEIVASAAKFLQDPSVASSPVENRIAFLQAKNLTREEVDAALARAASLASGAESPVAQAPPASTASGQPQPYYGQYPPQYSPYAWHQMPQQVPRRDWRDWFIMATVVSGLGYGLYSLGKRYVYPLVAPPTPGRLEQDKKSIDEQFEKAFALVEQLAKDTEALKAAERERTERLDASLSELENVIEHLKSANKRREDEARRIQEDVRDLKDTMPKTLAAQNDVTDSRLREVNTELRSLKTLITQRMKPPTATTPMSAIAPGLRSASVTSAATPANPSGGVDPADVNGRPAAAEEPKKQEYQDYLSGLNRSSPFSSNNQQAKASIPAWQMAMANKNTASSPAPNETEAASGSESQDTQGNSASASNN